MLLTIDIGNTHINFGVFSDKKGKEKLERKFKIPTSEIIKSKTFPSSYVSEIEDVNIKEVYMCSVVPQVTPIIKNIIQEKFNLNCKEAGEAFELPIVNLYRKPEEVGQDRLVNAFAVTTLYTVPALIVDFGTAITFDYINNEGEYEGGLIFPGVNVSYEALVEKASLLPRIKFSSSSFIIGKNTVESMNNGIIYGFSKMTDGIISEVKKDIGGRDIKVIGTGGDSGILKDYIEEISDYDNDLTLKGLYHLYKLNRDKG